jgi:hypothetical protein
VSGPRGNWRVTDGVLPRQEALRSWALTGGLGPDLLPPAQEEVL